MTFPFNNQDLQFINSQIYGPELDDSQGGLTGEGGGLTPTPTVTETEIFISTPIETITVTPSPTSDFTDVTTTTVTVTPSPTPTVQFACPDGYSVCGGVQINNNTYSATCCAPTDFCCTSAQGSYCSSVPCPTPTPVITPTPTPDITITPSPSPTPTEDEVTPIPTPDSNQPIGLWRKCDEITFQGGTIPVGFGLAQDNLGSCYDQVWVFCGNPTFNNRGTPPINLQYNSEFDCYEGQSTPVVTTATLLSVSTCTCYEVQPRFPQFSFESSETTLSYKPCRGDRVNTIITDTINVCAETGTVEIGPGGNILSIADCTFNPELCITPPDLPFPTPTPTVTLSPTVTPPPAVTPPPTWRDCTNGNVNIGFPPTEWIQAIYRGAGNGICWEPATTIGFSPSLLDALYFTHKRGSGLYPQPKKITATNSSYAISYRVTLTTNEAVIIEPRSFILEPRTNVDFFVNVTPELIEQLGDGRSTLQVNVEATEV
jgi:hypothetical protein